MSARASALDDEPEIVDHAHGATDNDGQEGEGSDSSEEESDDESTATKRLNEIRRGLKNDELDLHDKTKLEDFIHRNESYLDKRFDGEGDHENLLHLIAKDARDKAFDKYQPLVKVLLDRHPHLLEEKDLHEDTPLHLAINKKRDKFVRFICKTYTRKDINTILGIRNHSGNCLHVAIKKNIPIKLAVFLIGYAGEGTLHAKDNNGNTPLHIAVEYKRCTNAQLEIVQALVSKCDLAMSERTKDSLSPYQYHHHTRKEAKKEAAKENRVQLGKMNGTGTSGNGISGWNSGPEERDTAVMGSNFSGAPLDTDVPGSIRSLKLAENTSFDMEGGKLGPLRRVKTGSEAPNGMLGSNAGSNRSPIDAGGIGNKYSDLRAPKDTSRPTTSNDTTTSVGLKPAKGERKSKEIAEVTDDTANMILDYLKLHCLQTRLHDDAVDFLYGPGQEKQIYFDLYDFPSKEISQDRIQSGLDHETFEDVLQYVALPNIRVQTRHPIVNSNRISKKQPHSDGKGRNDMTYLFNFLRDKKVKHVIRVIVDDLEEPAHSDEVIENALGGLKVEIWDWRKTDLCSETIRAAAPDVREICLHWSGNNAVLRGWSEPGGLPLLRKMKKVTLHVAKGLETSRRTQNNIRAFQDRMKVLPDVKIEVIYEEELEKNVLTGNRADSAREQAEQRHEWLNCMDDFADFIQNVKPPLPLREEVTIALIDDGVDINEPSLHAKIIGGRSYCQRDKDLSRPYYVSNGGHGTLMATLICRVCPKAQLYVVKLDEHMSEKMKRQISARSAAKAVKAAIQKGVHIISMSWTIERTSENAADILDLEAAIEAAAKAGILMFCAANDRGVGRDKSFPAACSGTKHIFKIGTAEASGTAWKWVADPADVDFFFPGHNVLKDRPEDSMQLGNDKTLTGSSVATAFATGLAAVILYCVQLAGLDAQSAQPTGSDLQKQGQRVIDTMADFNAMQGHERMNEAFLAIGTSQSSLNKYIEVWKVFGSPSKRAERVGKERIEVVTEIARRLKTTNTLE